MRIFCFIDDLGAGGAQRQLVLLSAGFRKLGHQVEIGVHAEAHFYDSFLQDRGIPIHRLTGVNNWQRIRQLRALLVDLSPDRVIAFLPTAALYAELAALTLPFRSWKLLVGERSANPLILTDRRRKVCCWAHLISDAVVANSNANLQMVQRVCPLLNRKKCHVIYNAVDDCLWNLPNKETFRQDGHFQVVIAASLQKAKNLDGLVAAVQQLSPAEREILRIQWFGNEIPDPLLEKGWFEKLQRRIDELGLTPIFSFHPATQDIPQHIARADAVALFSHWEGLPNAVCEAMFAGKVVMASRVSDVPLLLDDSRLLCDSRSPEEIAAVLRHVLSLSDRELMNIGQRNRERARVLFDSRTIIQAYLDV